MERISCVQLRGNTYYFRQRLPHDIALMLGRAEIVRSLKTSCFDTAIARKRMVSAALESTLDLLRDIEPKDTETARDLFQKWFKSRLEKDFSQRQRAVRPVDPPYPSTELEKRQWIVDKPLGRTKLQSEARLIASVLIEKSDLEIDNDHLASLIEHGLHEMRTRIFPRRDEGDFSDEVNDRVVQEALHHGPVASLPPSAEVAKASGPSLGKAIESFLAEHRQAISAKTRLEYDQTFRLAQDFWGNDTPVGSIDKAAAREFKELLLKLPANMTQRLPGRTLQEAVAQGAKDSMPTISTKTINKKISNLSTFFGWLQDQGYVEDNPFSGLMIKDTASRRKRDPFSKAQLLTLFSHGAFAKGHLSRSTGADWQELENFWIPLIALFTGMRMGEICQLSVDDIRQVQGIWVFDVHDRADHQLKTKSSNRQTPAHAQLIDLGLLGYLEDVRKAGKAKLFPELPKASDGYQSSAFSKRFARYLTKSGVKSDKRITFHSFRHSMKDFLREAGVDRSVQDAICGHDDGSVQANYGSGYSAPALHKQLHRIEVPVDLSHLKPQSSED